MDYAQALQLIAQPIRATALPHSLDHVHQLLTALDSPQQSFPSVVVAGSVGKGTTCYQIAALMNNHLKVGLYTSPHLHSFRERFSINGRLISQAELLAGLEVIQRAVVDLSIRYSTFEMATALALWWFRQEHVELAVLEIGIGGRYDAVNTVNNALAVITPIELEHAAMLGGTLASIASHKAGIIKPNGDAISAMQLPEVEAILTQEAQNQQASLVFEPIDSLAVAACTNLIQRRIIPPFSLPTKSPFVQIEGRMEQHEINGKTIFIDGAHTPNSARRLRVVIEQLAPSNTSVRLIIGMLRDKAVHDFLAEFDAPRYHITLTQASGHRAIAADELPLFSHINQAQVIIEPNLQTAIYRTRDGDESLIVITGSLRIGALAREILGLLDEAALEEARTTRAIFEGQNYLSKLP